jgi:FkbM family methyltransferase
MPGPRNELRDRFDAGDLDKHAISREMRELNRALEDYAELLPRTDIGGLAVRDGQVFAESRLAPVRLAVDLGDTGTPPVLSLVTGTYEPTEMRVLTALLEGADTFLDVGANIGWYSLHAAAMYPGLRVVAVEPVPHTHAELRRNVELNDAAVELVEAGLSDAPGEIQIYVTTTLTGAASAAPSRDYPGQEPVTCAMTTLDALADELDLRLDVVKADVEGGELKVLQGGMATIERDRPAIMLEMLRIHAAPFGYHPNDIIDLLGGLGYDCYASSDDGVRPFERMDEQTVETNFFFLHPERHEGGAGALLG